MRKLSWLGVPALAIASAVVFGCVAADQAHAGTYVMRSCNVPGHPRAPAAPWRWILADNTYSDDECARGGGFGVNAGPMQRVTASAVVLEHPAEGPQSVVAFRRVRLWMISRLSSAGSSLFVGASAGGATGTTYSEVLFGPPGGDTLTMAYESPLLAPDTQSYVLLLSCSGNTWDGCVPSNPNPLEVRGAEVTLQEDVAPSGSVDGGTLLDGSPQAGVRTVNYTLRDPVSGVAAVSVALGSTEVGARDFKPECAYAGFAACPQTQSGSLAIDTRGLPDGKYPLALRVTDAAGNQETILAPGEIHVANGRLAPTPNGQGATADARLTAAFVQRRGAVITVPFGRRVAVRGRLTTLDGRPISNARVEIAEVSVARGAKNVTRAAITGSNGAYRYRSRGRSPSRRLEVRYRPNLGSTNAAASVRLRVNVAAAATLRVSLNGVRLSYEGVLRTRPIPADGKVVYIEGRAIGGAWTWFAVRRASRTGRFSGRYRLRVRRPGVRLQFRVRIPKQAGYPYAAGVGAPVARTVR